jgi:putative pyruvate formate lyase activating enzyme
MPAAYLEAYGSGRLDELIRRSAAWMTKCTLCPRLCEANRMAGETGYCRTGPRAVVASYGPHFGEERPLVGANGSGTIFFSNCNLFCNFCQNWDISHGGTGRPVSAGELASMMLSLQQRGCHNINFVTPSHVIHPVLEALRLAVERGLRVPLVYNCGGYERVSALKLLDGIVDIYMPDFKFWDPKVSEDLCGAPDYPERARAALIEMHRQTGDLVMDAEGIAQRGLLVRHLVLPGGMAGTELVVEFIAKEVSPSTYINIMDQYHPCGDASETPPMNRRIASREFLEAIQAAKRTGLTRLDDRHRHWMTIEF